MILAAFVNRYRLPRDYNLGSGPKRYSLFKDAD
jgi:hypothetical protein